MPNGTIIRKDFSMKAILDKKVDQLFISANRQPDYIKIADHIRNGFPSKYLLIVKSVLGLSNQVVSALLGISLRTTNRYLSEKEKLDSNASDKLFRVIYITYKTVEVFENIDEAVHWLKTPQYGLGERIPLDLIQTEAGAREVENLLGRIDYGVY